MRIFVPCFLLFLVSLAIAQSPSSKTLTPFEQELASNERQFMQALEAKNVSYVSGVVGPDFKGVSTNGDFYDRSEVIGTAKEGLPKNWRIYDLTVVRLDDSSAIVSYNKILPGSHPRYLHMSDTWAKENGQWKLKFQQATPNLWSATDLD